MGEWKCSAFERRAHAGRERSYIDEYPERAEFRDRAILRYWDSRSDAYLMERKKRVKAIRTKEEALAYRDHVREAFRHCVGPLPDCPPGRVQVTGTLHKDGYAVDRVRVESLPGVFVTANFYYPTGAATPCPAVLFPCGHAAEGKASPMYVSFGVEAAQSGFCTLIYDPIGQGERKLRSEPGGGSEEEWLSPVDAHCLFDRRLSVLGENAAAYMLAESIRALDYLLSRPEVDPNRVAVSGNSGGGMMSAYMGAYDDRVRAVAPCCYITELRAMLQRILAQDAEQCTPGFMERGLDLSDLITAAAPKPYHVGAALFDFFPIDGVRDALVEAKALYALMGEPSRIQASVAAKGHGMWVETRLAVLEFLCREFGQEFRGNETVDYEALPAEEELICSPGGPDGGEELEAFLAARLKAMFDGRQAAGKPVVPLRERLRAALKLQEAAGGEDQLLDRVELADSPSGFVVTRLRLESEPNMPVECLLVEPGNRAGLADRLEGAAPGTANIIVGPLPASISAFIQERVQSPAEAWLFIQPRGIGSAALHPRSSFGMFDVETGSGYYARLLGRTLPGLRLADVLAALRVLERELGYRPAAIGGVEEHALTALYAAVWTGITRVRLDGLPRSFRELAESEHHRWGHGCFGDGLGLRVDVPELLEALPAAGVEVTRWLDAQKREAEGPI